MRSYYLEPSHGRCRKNGEDSSEYPCGVPTPDHGEGGNISIRWFMGDTGGRVGATGGRHDVGGHVHSPLARKDITVGGPTTTIGGLHAGNWLRGGIHEEIAVVEAGGDIRIA